jgi:hypothetical protein
MKADANQLFLRYKHATKQKLLQPLHPLPTTSKPKGLQDKQKKTAAFVLYILQVSNPITFVLYIPQLHSDPRFTNIYVHKITNSF